MKPAMYLFVNTGLDMSAGKVAAQTAHAAVEAYRLSNQTEEGRRLVREWYVGGHYAKYVMKARDTEHLMACQVYLENRGFRTSLIIDEGHTEIKPITATALGVEVVDKDDPHTAASFQSFDLYRAPRPSQIDKWHKAAVLDQEVPEPKRPRWWNR